MWKTTNIEHKYYNLNNAFHIKNQSYKFITFFNFFKNLLQAHHSVPCREMAV